MRSSARERVRAAPSEMVFRSILTKIREYLSKNRRIEFTKYLSQKTRIDYTLDNLTLAI